MTNELVVQEVDFNGATLVAVKSAENGKVYVGASWICDGIGFNKNGKDTQIKKIQSDIVLKEGCVKFDAGVFDANNETIGIELDYLPLWLAKISITPKMKADSPAVVENLIEYQLKAKDVLAKVFIEKSPFIIPQNYKEALQQVIDKIEENETLKLENDELKPKAEFHDNVANTEGSDSIINVAKSFGIGEKKFFQFLRSIGVLFTQDGYNIPKQQLQNQGLFKVRMGIYDNGFQMKTTYKTTVTGEGKTHLSNLIKKYGGAESINKLKLAEIDGYVKSFKKVS